MAEAGLPDEGDALATPRQDEATGQLEELCDPKPEDVTSGLDEEEQDRRAEFAERIIRAASKLKGVKIDRAEFLRTEIRKHWPDADAELAVRETPAAAGLDIHQLDVLANEAIDLETAKCAGLAFLAGIPGGLAAFGAVPADLVQYFAHVMRIEQKLAYVYGWQSFLNEDDEVDDQSLLEFVLLMGVMMQVGAAGVALNKFASKVAQEGVARTIQRQALTKTAFYPILKKVLRVLGVRLTKEKFAQVAAKVVPVAGGVVAGGMTFLSFGPSSMRLRDHLRRLPQSGITAEKLEEETKDSIVDKVVEGSHQLADSTVVGAGQAARMAGDALGAGVGAAGRGLEALRAALPQKPAHREAPYDAPRPTLPTSDPFELIKKYKDLLDLGILTEEEFDLKKRELLGI